MKNEIKHILLALSAAFLLYACSPADGNFGGTEYMPDMAHSIAQEANVYTYYYYNTWDSASTFRLKDLAMPGLPVAGTVPRGYAGVYAAEIEGHSASDVVDELRGKDGLNNIAVQLNGHVPYHYGDTEDERLRATAEIIANPFPITSAGLTRGQGLYNIYCGICHGEKGDGLGYLVSEANKNAKYPAAPANFLQDQFVESSNGRYYHAIMYGKNVMGSYRDKLSYEERWQVIHWIRSLQAKDKKLEYSENANTFNPQYGVPGSQVSPIAQSVSDDTTEPEPTQESSESVTPPAEEGGHSSDSHSQGRK